MTCENSAYHALIYETYRTSTTYSQHQLHPQAFSNAANALPYVHVAHECALCTPSRTLNFYGHTTTCIIIPVRDCMEVFTTPMRARGGESCIHGIVYMKHDPLLHALYLC